MHKNTIIISSLKEIKHSLELIAKRSQQINSADDFLANEEGIEKLDSISMRLVAIGEAFKNIDKIDSELLEKYPLVPWKEIKGIRDVLSHHYFNIDAEIIFNICKEEISKLLEATNTILQDLTLQNQGKYH